ncbi:MAG: hypothetical protein ABI440_08955 [Casimicrobiaceae bacterium]
MFVAVAGFIGSWSQAIFSRVHLFLSGAAGAKVATLFTFLPSFVFILIGDEGLVKRVGGDLSVPIYYLAGPPAMVEAIRLTLNGAGIDDDDIRGEGFYGY